MLCVEGREGGKPCSSSVCVFHHASSSEVRGLVVFAPPLPSQAPTTKARHARHMSQRVRAHAMCGWVLLWVLLALWLACERKTTKQRRAVGAGEHSFSSRQPKHAIESYGDPTQGGSALCV